MKFISDSTRTSGLLFTNGDGDSLNLVTWNGLHAIDRELIDNSSKFAITGYFFADDLSSDSIFLMIADLNGDSLSFFHL